MALAMLGATCPATCETTVGKPCMDVTMTSKCWAVESPMPRRWPNQLRILRWNGDASPLYVLALDRAQTSLLRARRSYQGLFSRGQLNLEEKMAKVKNARKRRWQVGCNYVGHLVEVLKVYSRQDRFAMKKYRLWLEEV